MAPLYGRKRARPVLLLALAGALLIGLARPVASFVLPASSVVGGMGRAAVGIGRGTLRQGLRMSGDPPKFEKKRNKVTSTTASSSLFESIDWLLRRLARWELVYVHAVDSTGGHM